MTHSLFHLSLPPEEFVIRAFAIFLYVLVLLRVSGKRQLAQMSATEFVAILLISNAVQNAMNGGDNSLMGGLILAGTLIFLSWLISWLTFRYHKARAIFEGTPTIVIHKGAIITKNLVKERLPKSELITLLRKQGFHHLPDIHTAVLEADGTLSVTRMPPNDIFPESPQEG